MMNGFTGKNKKLWIIEIHNLYLELKIMLPSDQSEWLVAIHDLQKILSMRILRRELPDTFPTYMKIN